MEKQTVKQKVKKFWKDNKEVIVPVGVALGAITALCVSVSNSNKKLKDENDKMIAEIENAEYEPIDYGRDCLITYSVEDTGEVLWKERCCETYVEDVKESGMYYEEVCKLNGIDIE